MSDVPREEVLKYKLEVDVQSAQATAQRVQALTAEITQRRGAGETTDLLEQQLQRELNALGRLNPELKKSSGLIGELDKNKRDLADVVKLLGGRFGGLLGDVLGSIQAFTMLGRTVGVAAAGLAGLTVAIQIYQAWRAEIRKTIEEQERLNEAQRKNQEQAAGARGAIGAKLEQAGALTAGNEELAMQLARQLREQFGFSMEQAGSAAAGAVSAGMGTFDEAALLAALQARGASFEKPEDIVAAINNLRESPGGDALLREQLAARAQSESALRERAVGALDKESGAVTPIQRLFEALSKRGELPPGVTSVEQLRDKMGPDRTSASDFWGFVSGWLGRAAANPFGSSGKSIIGEWAEREAQLHSRISVLEQRLQQIEGLPTGAPRSPAAPPGVSSGPLGTPEQRRQVGAVVNVGTMHVNGANARRRPRHPTSLPSGLDDSVGGP